MTFPTSRNDLRWWTKSIDRPAAVANSFIGYAKALEGQASTRARDESFRRWARMYGNSEILGIRPWEYMQRMTESRVTRNVIASCIDTATAMIAQSRPAPQFLTNGADFELRRKAQKLNKFGKGLLHQVKAYDDGPVIFRDAAIFGTGIGKVYGDDGALCMDRVMPWDILVEDADAFMGKPRTMVQRMYVDRQIAAETWKDEVAQQYIRTAKAMERGPGDTGASDQIVLYEGWHLPSKAGGSDGRHVIAMEGHVLLDEPWKRDRHPFAVFRWEAPIAGFWGRGIAERLYGLQLEINRLLIKIQDTMHLAGVTKIIMDAGAGVPKAHVNNEVGAILMVNQGRNPPTVIAPQSVHPETFQQVDRLEMKAFDEIGISQMAARSEKPAGLDSGVALREYNDTKSERFTIVQRAWERWHLDLVSLGLDEAREIRGFSVDVPDRNNKIVISWKDVDLKRESYVLQCFPTSLLPQTPAGRLQTVSELMQSGLIPKERALEILNAPDLDELNDTVSAAIRAVRARIESMLDREAFRSPEAFDNLSLCASLTTAVYLDEREKGCPEEVLENLRRFINEANALIQDAQASAAPAPVPAPMPQQMASGAPAGPMPAALPMAA